MYTTDANICRPWMESRLQAVLGPYATFLARLRPDGSIWGCVAYDRHTKHNCEMHMAGDPRWVSRDFLRHAFRYPFHQLGYSRVTGLVDARKTDVLSMDKRMGFKEEGRLRDGLGPGLDIIVLGMKPDECRYNWSI